MKEQEKLSIDTMNVLRADKLTNVQIQNHFSADRQAIAKKIDPADAEKSSRILARAIKERRDMIEFLTRQIENLESIKGMFDNKATDDHNV